MCLEFKTGSDQYSRYRYSVARKEKKINIISSGNTRELVVQDPGKEAELGKVVFFTQPSPSRLCGKEA